MKNKGMTLLLSLALVAGLFGVLPAHATYNAPMASTTIVINEIKPGPGNPSNPTTDDDEWVELLVVSSGSINITGWVLTDQDSSAKGSTCNNFAGCNYVFPQIGGSDCLVASGDYVLVYSGSGTNSCTGTIKRFYMGVTQGIWNNLGDDVGLYRPDTTCTTAMVVGANDLRSNQNYRPVDYVAYGTGTTIDNYPGGTAGPATTCSPVSDWQWSNPPSTPSSAQTLALTPNGIDTDTGTDWEIAGSGTAPGPLTYATTAGGTPGWNNNNPTLAVTLADFYAVQQGDAVQVSWETVSEVGNAGFNLYRSEDPAALGQQLNAALIPSQSPGSTGGFSYTWEDRAGLAAGSIYFYTLEDVDLSGATTRHGPVSAAFVAPTAVTVSSVQAGPVAPAALPLVGTLLALLAPLAVGLRRTTD